MDCSFSDAQTKIHIGSFSHHLFVFKKDMIQKTTIIVQGWRNRGGKLKRLTIPPQLYRLKTIKNFMITTQVLKIEARMQACKQKRLNKSLS